MFSSQTLFGVPVQPGQHLIYRLSVGSTHGGFAVEVPLHLIFGARPGPTLVVQAGLSGLEIEPALTLPAWVAGIDPSALRGNLLVAPLFNLSGFEFEQIQSAWDGADLTCSGAGRSGGTVSEQLLDAYATAVLECADAVIDIRTGAQWGYYRYVGVHDVGGAERVAASMALASVLGLPHAAIGEPVGATLAGTLAERGLPVVTVWLGGGPGLREYREQDAESLVDLLSAALKHFGMVEGTAPTAGPAVRIHTIVRPTGPRGLVFMDATLRGQTVAAGDELGVVRHPFEGSVVARVVAPRAGVLLHAGASWPVVLEGTTLAVLGDPL